MSMITQNHTSMGSHKFVIFHRLGVTYLIIMEQKVVKNKFRLCLKEENSISCYTT